MGGVRPWRACVIFDVGANNGESFIRVARWFNRWQIIAFEPTPVLVAQIKAATKGLENYQVVPRAVAESKGVLKFHVAGQGDWGCSSLLEFSPDRAETWAGRTDLVVTETIDVEAIRLDEFVLQNKVQVIDFLHVDTQGTDLSVLRSLGTELHRVRAGVIEVPQAQSVMLYKGQHTKEECVAFLREHGFYIRGTTRQHNEENLYFCRCQGR